MQSIPFETQLKTHLSSKTKSAAFALAGEISGGFGLRGLCQCWVWTGSLVSVANWQEQEKEIRKEDEKENLCFVFF